MAALGLDPARFGAHSLRIGGATAALAAGVPPSLIRVLGRWSSDIYQIYCRLSAEAAAGMAAVVGSTPFQDVEQGEFVSEETQNPNKCTPFREKLQNDDLITQHPFRYKLKTINGFGIRAAPRAQTPRAQIR